MKDLWKGIAIASVFTSAAVIGGKESTIIALAGFMITVVIVIFE